MARPRSDPFDAPAIRAAIERGETTERLAYLAYASTAGRPYARSTFSNMLRRADDPPPTIAARPQPQPQSGWRERNAVKPRILALGAGGGLRVRAGSLIVFDGETTLTYSKSAKPPVAIILSTVGGFVSMEAVRWAARARGGHRPRSRTRLFVCHRRRAQGERRALAGASRSRPSADCAGGRCSENSRDAPCRSGCRGQAVSVRAHARHNPRSSPQCRGASVASGMA